MTDPATQTTTTSASTTNGMQGPSGGQTSPPTDDGTGPNAGTQTSRAAEPERRYTQDDIDRVVSERLNRQKAQLAREAEEARLKAQQEWQLLAQKHESRVKELEPTLEQMGEAIKARDALLLATVKAETKDWPAEAKALVPHEADALAQMAAVDKARPLVAKLAEQASGAAGTQQGSQNWRPPGNTPGPRPAQEPNKSLVERELERLRATGVYGNRGPR